MLNASFEQPSFPGLPNNTLSQVCAPHLYNHIPPYHGGQQKNFSQEYNQQLHSQHNKTYVPQHHQQFTQHVQFGQHNPPLAAQSKQQYQCSALCDPKTQTPQHCQGNPAQAIQPQQCPQYVQHSPNNAPLSAASGTEQKMPPEAEAILRSMKNGMACPRSYMPSGMMENSSISSCCSQSNWKTQQAVHGQNQDFSQHHLMHPNNSRHASQNIHQTPCRHTSQSRQMHQQNQDLYSHHSAQDKEYFPHTSGAVQSNINKSSLVDDGNQNFHHQTEPNFSAVQNSLQNPVQNVHGSCSRQHNTCDEGEGRYDEHEYTFPVIAGPQMKELLPQRKVERADGLQDSFKRSKNLCSASKNWLTRQPNQKRGSRKSFK